MGDVAEGCLEVQSRRAKDPADRGNLLSLRRREERLLETYKGDLPWVYV